MSTKQERTNLQGKPDETVTADVAANRNPGITPVAPAIGDDSTPAKTGTPADATADQKDELWQNLVKFGLSQTEILYIIDNLGVTEMSDFAMLTEQDLLDAGLKVVGARRLLASLRESNSPQPSTAAPATANFSAIGQFDNILPTVPSEESWLNALKAGGVLKVDESSYIAAIRAALADRAGLYNVPMALVKAMEQYADESDEQVGPMFYALRKALTRRTYGDIFQAIDGLDGSFITDARRKEFLKRVQDILWPAITDSFEVLDGWYQNWSANSTNPSMMFAAITASLGNGIGPAVTIPDTAILHDAGETLINAINRVFRGTGVPVAAALAYEAGTIRNTLEDIQLPSLVGVKNREMMLKKIGINVSSNYIRLEQNLVKYVLAYVKHNAITSDVEPNYFMALWQLGNQINWKSLNSSSGITGITGKTVL